MFRILSSLSPMVRWMLLIVLVMLFVFLTACQGTKSSPQQAQEMPRFDNVPIPIEGPHIAPGLSAILQGRNLGGPITHNPMNPPIDSEGWRFTLCGYPMRIGAVTPNEIRVTAPTNVELTMRSSTQCPLVASWNQQLIASWMVDVRGRYGYLEKEGSSPYAVGFYEPASGGLKPIVGGLIRVEPSKLTRLALMGKGWGYEGTGTRVPREKVEIEVWKNGSYFSTTIEEATTSTGVYGGLMITFQFPGKEPGEYEVFLRGRGYIGWPRKVRVE